MKAMMPCPYTDSNRAAIARPESLCTFRLFRFWKAEKSGFKPPKIKNFVQRTRNDIPGIN